MAWSTSRGADLDALAKEALADPTLFASCCGLAILRRHLGVCPKNENFDAETACCLNRPRIFGILMNFE